VSIRLGKLTVMAIRKTPNSLLAHRSLAATQVNGVSGAVHDSFETKREAYAAFERAEETGLVAVLD
jgi:major membrane immunogen (membrane-anchored lipoprotein)